MNLRSRSRISLRIITPLILLYIICSGNRAIAQGRWVPLANKAPNQNIGVMLLLTDGSVIANCAPRPGDTISSIWSRLSPDALGSYANGTWSYIAPMYHNRLYFSSQVLQDGRVYVAGGEYGNGKRSAEIYDPVADVWPVGCSLPGNLPFALDTIADGNSELLPDGKVLQAVVRSDRQTFIFDPATDSFYTASPSLGGHDESTWVKLADSSILFIDLQTRNSERYIPSLAKWLPDATLPDDLYDSLNEETGPAFLLPDGRAFFTGGTGHTAYYTPSGDTTKGSWTAGPDLPGNLCTPDASGAMMTDGNILLTLSAQPRFKDDFQAPTYFYCFDYRTNLYTRITAPDGQDTLAGPSYITHMLDLPDGGVLFSSGGSTQYYEYIPANAPLPAGKPVVNEVMKQTCSTWMASGTLFNGITEGAGFGDDWQMATNYPIVTLTNGDSVYFARTHHWNRTGVMTGNLPDTTLFDLPAGLPEGYYQLRVVANGNPSDPVVFSTCNAVASNGVTVSPNPANDAVHIGFMATTAAAWGMRITNMMGQTVLQQQGTCDPGNNTLSVNTTLLARGVYILELEHNGQRAQRKLVLY